ncbi:FlgO family outer membrane protein [Leptospira santarosai]|uniref:PF13036 family protein n=2 Tax=Leptospira santarosai TaxID=28183 RepID=M6V001_9LEPT|nr:FlgO family outer membrane protein [Leptospira santarosai]AVV52098.1 Curli production assembly/transport component CsgG domain protein [Leptospira santarosai]EKO34123.1 PF13036 family protein [Leptospira santarosai str. MOR084]EKR93607.1 PF13036 family protein [Leptospira santarosai str. CBC379]EKS10043.1 PF13036 family protein [Leptospira santarosai str. JET]EMJ46475.1 PF13036 family protein [Leptospira santarosai str. HAI1349]
MKHSILIIFFFLLFFADCATGRPSKRFLPKPLDLREISTELKKQIDANRQTYFPEKKGALKLIVLPLLNENGSITVLGSTISSQLLSQMYDPGRITLVEKSQLGRLIDEQSFQKSGLVLSDQNLEIGKLSGADLLLLGTVQFNDQTFLLQLRVVSLRSGEILALSESVFDSNDTFYDQYRSVTTVPRN